MSEDKRSSVPEQDSDDDLLKGMQDALRPADQGAKAAGEHLEEDNADSDEEPEEDNNDEEDDSDSDDASDGEEEDDDDKDSYFKREIGRQANEIGELRKQLREMQEKGQSQESTQQAIDEREAKLTAMRERWGDALVNDLQELLNVELAPVKSQLTNTALRERYPDIDGVKDEMEKIFRQSPALQVAAQQDTAVLDTVYAAAKAKIGSASGQKVEARKKMVAKQKADGHVEKPSPKAPPKPKVTEEEWGKGFVDTLITLPPNA